LIYNEIERRLNLYGLSEATAYNNREGIVPDGYVQENGDIEKLPWPIWSGLEKLGACRVRNIGPT
jgi:hypothetical protein